MTPEEKQIEEAKRDRCVSPARREQLLLQTIAWAEQQETVRRNTKEACLANQARILAWMERDKNSRNDAPDANANHP